MRVKQLRNATFRDAQAIDGLIAAMPPLLRDLHSWVNQADFHVALVDGDAVVGFGARAKHKSHPQRDLAAVHAIERADVEALYDAVRGRKPLKVRLPADDYDGLTIVGARGFTERIRSATYRVPADEFGDAGAYRVEEVFSATREVTDAFTIFYAGSHLWDPPAIYTRRFVRQTMLAGSQHIALVRDDDGVPIGVGAAHANDDPSVAVDIALVGPLDQSHPDADGITRSLLAHLAGFYRGETLWFEVDTGDGTNVALARLVTPRATAEDEVVILTSD